MSTLEHESEAPEGRESGLLHREFAAEMTPGDGRTVDLRIVPYDEPTLVADPGRGQYEEEFVQGVFSHQMNAANRVLANFEHQQGIAGIVGQGITLREAGDGFYGSFRMHETPDGDKALMLIKEGILDGVSVEFAPKKSIRTAAGVVRRVKAHLDSIALTRRPAYAGARVLAVREEEIVMDEEMLPPAPSADLLERCRRLGIDVPDSMAVLLVRAFTETQWDGSSSRWDSAAAYCSACAIDRNPAGKPKVKELCSLPYKEPGSGDVNVNGVRAALARLGQGFPQDATQAERDRARALLERLLAQFNQQQ